MCHFALSCLPSECRSIWMPLLTRFVHSLPIHNLQAAELPLHVRVVHTYLAWLVTWQASWRAEQTWESRLHTL